MVESIRPPEQFHRLFFLPAWNLTIATLNKGLPSTGTTWRAFHQRRWPPEMLKEHERNACDPKPRGTTGELCPSLKTSERSLIIELPAEADALGSPQGCGTWLGRTRFKIPPIHGNFTLSE